MTHYETLGVSPTATTGEIRAAYIAASKAHHPDTGGDAETMAKLNAAYDTLKDKSKRARYDQSGYSEATGPSPEEIFNAQVVDIQTQTFSLVIERKSLEDLDHFDILAEVISMMKVGLRETDNVLFQTNLQLRRYKRAYRNLKAKKGGLSSLHYYLQQQIENAIKSLKMIAEQKRAIKEAIRLTGEGYEFKFKPKPKEPPTSYDIFLHQMNQHAEGNQRPYFQAFKNYNPRG